VVKIANDPKRFRHRRMLAPISNILKPLSDHFLLSENNGKEMKLVSDPPRADIEEVSAGKAFCFHLVAHVGNSGDIE
jgi:hypothetical protein